jgi:hypothetical protein
VVSVVVSPQFFPARALGIIILDLHPFAGVIKRHPEVEVLPVTKDNRAVVMKKVLN